MALYIFDKDGTLVSGLGNRPANTPDEQQPLPGVVAKLSELRAAGHKIAVASNQGGVAWGFITNEQVQLLMEDMVNKLGGPDTFDSIDWSPFDPRATQKNPDSRYACDDETRKPHPGMLLNIMHLAFADEIAADDTIMVGDSETDKLAADAAGVHFVWARDFFGW